MKPKDYYSTVLDIFRSRGLVLIAVFGLANYWQSGVMFRSGEFLVAFVLAIVFSAGLALRAKEAVICLSFTNRDRFVDSLNIGLVQAGFSPEVQSNNTLIYKPRPAEWFQGSGRIRVELESGKATIVGSVRAIDRLTEAT